MNIVGKTYGRLTVVQQAEKDKERQAWYLCKCQCGKEIVVRGTSLRNGHTQSCGCSHNDLIKDISGQRFGKILVLGDSGKRRKGSGGVLWHCRCDCGQEKDIRQDSLLSGIVISCGCLRSKGNEKVAGLLRNANIEYIPEYSPQDLMTFV